MYQRAVSRLKNYETVSNWFLSIFWCWKLFLINTNLNTLVFVSLASLARVSVSKLTLNTLVHSAGICMGCVWTYVARVGVYIKEVSASSRLPVMIENYPRKSELVTNNHHNIYIYISDMVIATVPSAWDYPVTVFFFWYDLLLFFTFRLL